jgi:hypothetical protein
MLVTKEFAVRIDTTLAELHGKRWDVIDGKFADVDSLEFYKKHYPKNVESIANYEKKIASAQKIIVEINTAIKSLDDIYDQDPWTRAFLVVNNNGHVHSSLNCSTCFDTTRYQWLVQYSNDDEKTIVEDAGKDACTICYPSAPADVLNRASRIVTADKIAKAQAKAERDAKKEAKIAKEKANAPTASGKSLYFKDGKYTEEIKTERSAVSRWLDNQYWILNSNNPEQQQSKKQVNYIICESLAGKNGVSFDQQLKILENKYKKKGR